jgi:alginate O-acetyltransferase complex protein AlgJ
MKNLIKYIYIIVFSISISIIGILTILKVETTQNEFFKLIENRMPTPKPKLEFNFKSIKNYLTTFDSYFKDHFSFRVKLISKYSQLNQHIGVSLKQGKAVFGRNNFIFLGNNSQKVIDQTTGKNVFTEKELKEWIKIFSLRKEYLQMNGIPLYIIIPPNTHTVYPEYLPQYIVPSENNRLNQLLNCDSKLNIISLKEILLNSKSEWGDKLYYKNDTHWSEFGAYIGYSEIIRQLSAQFKELKAIELTKENFKLLPPSGPGDLERMCYLSNSPGSFKVDIIKDKNWEDRITKTDFKGETLPFNSLDKIQVYDQCVVVNKKMPYTLLILKDSYSFNLSLFLNQSFGKVVYCHYKQNEGIELVTLVERYKPDLVIYEMAERMLCLKQTIHPDILIKLGQGIESICKMDGEYLFRNVKKYINITDVKLDCKELLFSAKNEDPYFLIPEIKIDKRKDLVVNIKFTAPDEGISQLFYITKTTNFNQTQSLKEPIKKGYNEVVFCIPEKNINGKNLRFDPGNKIGAYTIHSIEVFEMDELIE